MTITPASPPELCPDCGLPAAKRYGDNGCLARCPEVAFRSVRQCELNTIKRLRSELATLQAWHAIETDRLHLELSKAQGALHDEKTAHTKLKAHYDDWLDRIINGKGDPEKEAAIDTIRSCVEEFASRCEKYQTELSKSQQKVSELETRIAELQCGR